MSIAGIGSNPGASQMLAALLSRLQNPAATTTAAGSTPATASSCQNGDDTTDSSTSSNSLTGTTTPSLSSMVLGALIAQQQSAGAGAATAATTSTTSTTANPVQNLFSAMDTDGNGSVSQSELEQYIQKQGGTQTEADNLYTMLSGAGSAGSAAGGITEAQLASQAPAAPPGAGGAHGHHHHHGSGSGQDLADQLLSAVNADGTTTNANGTSTDSTATDPMLAVAGLGSSASLSSSPFASIVSQLQQSDGSGFYSPLLSGFNSAMASNATSKPGSSLAITA